MTTEKKTHNSINWGGFWQAQKKDYFISQPISKASLKKLLDTGEKQRIVVRKKHYRNGNPKTPVFQFTFINADEGKDLTTIDLPHSRFSPYEKENEDNTEERKYTYEEVMACIHGACLDGQNGYDPYDLLIEDYI